MNTPSGLEQKDNKSARVATPSESTNQMGHIKWIYLLTSRSSAAGGGSPVLVDLSETPRGGI